MQRSQDTSTKRRLVFGRIIKNFHHKFKDMRTSNFGCSRKIPAIRPLNFKKLEGHDYWSVRVTRGYRAVAFEDEEGFVWFSIEKHDDVYESFRE